MTLLLALACTLAADTAVTPLPRAHAHNDYYHDRPLRDALDHGFGSIEADIFLVEDDVWVAHDVEELDASRTLRSLYLEPLRQRAQANGGKIYPGAPPLILLVDIKTWSANKHHSGERVGGEQTYPVLRRVLEDYRDILTVWHDDHTEPGAVSVIISGNTPRAQIAAESPRLMAIDGRPHDLDTDVNPNLIPLMSSAWFSHFRWFGLPATMPEDQRATLDDLVQRAHAHGMKVRFWGGPQTDVIYQTQYDAGVDLLNTDDLSGLRDFLLEQREEADSDQPDSDRPDSEQAE